MKENQKSTESIIKNAIKQELSSLTQEITRLQSELETVSDVAKNAIKLSEELRKEFTQLKEENTSMKYKLQNSINEQDKTLKIIEDNKNRQLRKTLVFKGIPENKFNDDATSLNPDGSPKMRPENWDDTATILAESISEALDNTSVDQARKLVERCHRGAVNPRYHGTAPRPIFAAFADWRDSERVKEAMRKININNTDSKVYCENKFGPRTTVRRNLALKERKRLIAEGTIFNGYVSHPARLMAKDSRAKGDKYKLWHDYSKEPVKFDR